MFHHDLRCSHFPFTVAELYSLDDAYEIPVTLNHDPFAALLLAPSGYGAPAKGWFGFVADVSAPGFSFNPTLRSVTIAKIIPGSPAAKAGLTAGDQVIEVEGLAIAGHKAKELQEVIQKSVGETLHLRLKRSGGEIYSAALVAEAKPEGQ